MAQSLKWVAQARRDPALGYFPGFEFDVLARNKIIGQNGRETVTILDPYLTGRDCLFAKLPGWDVDIVAPSPIVLDAQGQHPAYPSNLDPVWSQFLTNGKQYPKALRGYSGTEGAKAMIFLSGGTTRLLGGKNFRITGYEQGTPNGNLCGIYGLTDDTKLWADCQIDLCDDGVRGHFAWAYFGPDALLTKNGSGDGQSHGAYIEATVAVVDGGQAIDNKIGHGWKWLTELLHVRKERSHNTLTTNGQSYDHDVSGGMALFEDDELYDLPDTNGYVNTGTMVNFSTARKPNKWHALVFAGVKTVANVPVRGQFFRVQNPTPVFNPADPNGNYHTAPLMTNSDGSPVNMPVLVLVDGCDGQYAPGKISYITNNWLVPNNNGITLVQPIKPNNTLRQIGPTDTVTRVDKAKLASVHPLLAKLANIGTYTEAKLDDLVSDMIGYRKALTYPVADAKPRSPLPPIQPPLPADEDEAVIEEQRVIIAQLTKQIEDDAVANAAALKAVSDERDALKAKLALVRGDLATAEQHAA
jgi:hypothetical protein